MKQSQDKPFESEQGEDSGSTSYYADGENVNEEIESEKEVEGSSQPQEESRARIELTIPKVAIKNNTTKYTEKELLKLINSNSEEILSYITEMNAKFPELEESVKALEKTIESIPKDVNDYGMSIFSLKIQFLFQYIEYLNTYLEMKLDGCDFESHPLFESIVRARTLCEKLSPLELKLKSYIDSVLHPEPERSGNNPLSFHANISDLDTDEESSSEEEKKEKKYIPPKVAAVPYSEKEASRDESRREALKEKIANNAYINELRSEMTDRPEAIQMRTTGDRRLDREIKERQAFEENNFMRVNLNREQKKQMRQANMSLKRGRKMGEFDEFDSLSRLVNESEQINRKVIEEDEYGNRVKKVRSDGKEGKKKGRFGKKRGTGRK